MTSDLTKRPPERASGPAWIVVPARVIAVVIVLPVRFVYDLVAAILRGLWAIPRWIGRGLLAVYMALLHPGVRWFYSAILVPIGRVLAAIGRAVGAALRWLGSGIGRILDVLIARPLVALCLGIAWLAQRLWRYVLRPPLVGLAWLLGILIVTPLTAFYRYLLRPLGRGLAAAWLAAGRVLRWLWRTLFVPIGEGIAVVWRVTVATPCRWVNRTFIAPVRQVVRDVRMQFRRAFGMGRDGT